MARVDPAREFAHYHRPEDFRGLELLTARFLDFEFLPHVHEGYVVALIESGAERFRYRGAEHVAPLGTLAVVNPDEVHTGRRAADSGWSYRVFYPSFDLIRELAEDMGGWSGGTPFFPEAVVDDPRLVQPLRALHLALAAPSTALERESRWLDVMGVLLRRHARGMNRRSPGSGGDAVARVRELLREQLDGQVSLGRLAAESGLSTWHLNRMFRQRYGLPPHAYHLQLRLARARLWLQTPMPIAEISARLGFADQAHLSRLFKRMSGLSPAAYRRAARMPQEPSRQDFPLPPA